MSDGRAVAAFDRATLDNRILIWSLRSCAAFGLLAAVRVVALYWNRSPTLFLRTKSSIWVALAWDAAHGELYRPVVSSMGYGGTRYMPLLFIAHGGLLRAGFDPIWSGFFLMHVSVVTAALALFVSMRAFGVDRAFAMPLAATVWGTIIFQQSCTDLIPDYYAAALVLGAATAAIGSGRDKTRAIVAAALIVLATLTKVTAAAFAVPIAISLWLEHDRRVRAFCITTIVGLTLALALIDRLSAGNFHRSFLATAVAGMTWSKALGAAPQFLRELAIKPFDVGAPFLVAAWCARRCRVPWPTWYLVTASLVAVAIFMTPGTASNHLVDLQLASTLAIGAALARRTLHPRIVSGVYAAITIMIVAITIPVPGLPSVVAEINAAGPRPRDTAIVLRRIVPADGPWLSIDPIVPILNGERPWLLDIATVDSAYERQTPLGRDIASRIQKRFFTAIVVPDGYDAPLMRLMEAGYTPRPPRAPFTVFVPRADGE